MDTLTLEPGDKGFDKMKKAFLVTKKEGKIKKIQEELDKQITILNYGKSIECHTALENLTLQPGGPTGRFESRDATSDFAITRSLGITVKEIHPRVERHSGPPWLLGLPLHLYIGQHPPPDSLSIAYPHINTSYLHIDQPSQISSPSQNGLNYRVQPPSLQAVSICFAQSFR
jgi:hypothetical protein